MAVVPVVVAMVVVAVVVVVALVPVRVVAWVGTDGVVLLSWDVGTVWMAVVWCGVGRRGAHLAVVKSLCALCAVPAASNNRMQSPQMQGGGALRIRPELRTWKTR